MDAWERLTELVSDAYAQGVSPKELLMQQLAAALPRMDEGAAVVLLFTLLEQLERAARAQPEAPPA